jgi:hypothetical protein
MLNPLISLTLHNNVQEPISDIGIESVLLNNLLNTLAETLNLCYTTAVPIEFLLHVLYDDHINQSNQTTFLNE